MAWFVQEYLKSVPPSVAFFSHEEPDTIVYTGYGFHKYIQLYSIAQGKVCRGWSSIIFFTCLNCKLVEC